MGTSKNTAYKQVASNGVGADIDTISGIDSDIDGRDLYSIRITGEWDITYVSNLWVMYSRFEEDDDRARVTNQVRATNPVPTIGCLPNETGFDTPNAYTGTGGIIFGLGAGAYSNIGPTVAQKYDRGDVGFRKMHTDFEPVFKEEEDLLAFGFEYAFDNSDFGFTGTWQEREYLAQQDYYMDTGALLFAGSVDFPISAPAGEAGDEWRSGPCNYNDGTSGARSVSNPSRGCALNADGSVYYAYDQADSHSEYWTLEAKVQSSYEGKFNFVLGANTYKGESYGDYYVIGNSLDVAGSYPGMFNNTDDPDHPAISKGWAIFGETYYDVTDSVKFTLGLRYNEDKREDYGTNTLFNSFDLNGSDYLDGALGDTTHVRTTLGTFIFGAPLGDQTALAELYGITQQEIDAAEATGPASPERIALATAVPAVPQAAETRYLTGSPTSFKFKEWSGRVGLDWIINNDSMVYGFFSRGYKPGGLNPAIPVDFQNSSEFSYDSEEINAFEIGTKNTFLDGSMVVNGALFFYDYTGLQVTRIVNNSSLNDNIDSKIWGVEGEMFWRPDFIPGLGIDLSYSYTDNKVDGSESVDPTNRTAVMLTGPR